MIMRMATFGGVPVFLGIGVFVWFYFQATSETDLPADGRRGRDDRALGARVIGDGAALSRRPGTKRTKGALGVDEIKLNVGAIDGRRARRRTRVMREDE